MDPKSYSLKKYSKQNLLECLKKLRIKYFNFSARYPSSGQKDRLISHYGSSKDNLNPSGFNDAQKQNRIPSLSYSAFLGLGRNFSRIYQTFSWPWLFGITSNTNESKFNPGRVYSEIQLTPDRQDALSIDKSWRI